tara:strand:+ start:272 stop:514 length:243 start_codon:yes stop_codon:yes gene_type:complete
MMRINDNKKTKGEQMPKTINVLKLISDTYKGRKMFGFMTAGELLKMDKVKRPIRQTKGKVSLGSHVDKFLKEKANMKGGL